MVCIGCFAVSLIKKTDKSQESYIQIFMHFLSIDLLTYPLFHFVSPVFIKELNINYLTQNLVSLVSFVSHFRETKQWPYCSSLKNTL